MCLFWIFTKSLTYDCFCGNSLYGKICTIMLRFTSGLSCHNNCKYLFFFVEDRKKLISALLLLITSMALKLRKTIVWQTRMCALFPCTIPSDTYNFFPPLNSVLGMIIGKCFKCFLLICMNSAAVIFLCCGCFEKHGINVPNCMKSVLIWLLFDFSVVWILPQWMYFLKMVCFVV